MLANSIIIVGYNYWLIPKLSDSGNRVNSGQDMEELEGAFRFC